MSYAVRHLLTNFHLYFRLELNTNRIMFDLGNRAQSGNDLPGVAIVLIVAGVVLFVGIQVMSQVIDQTALEPANASGEGEPADPLYNASQDVQTGIDDAFGLFGVAFLVVILSVIVVYLYGLRGGR